MWLYNTHIQVLWTHIYTYIHTYTGTGVCRTHIYRYWRMQNYCTTSDRFKRFTFQLCRLLLVVNVKKKSTLSANMRHCTVMKRSLDEQLFCKRQYITQHTHTHIFICTQTHTSTNTAYTVFKRPCIYCQPQQRTRPRVTRIYESPLGQI